MGLERVQRIPVDKLVPGGFTHGLSFFVQVVKGPEDELHQDSYWLTKALRQERRHLHLLKVHAKHIEE